MHPHLRCLVTDGGENSEGRFHHLPPFQNCLLSEFFSLEVFPLLLREELMSEARVCKVAGWRHSEFSVHSWVRAKTKTEAEKVGKFMIRPLLSLERLSLDEREANVCYGYGEGPEEPERMDYLDFIARVTAHIPDKDKARLLYYGLYGNALRRKVCKVWRPGFPMRIVEEEPRAFPPRAGPR